MEDSESPVIRNPDDGDWRELVTADNERNVGMPIELLSAAAYAAREGITREAYIIKVLRAERDRLQELDRITADAAMMDEIIDGAGADGVTVVEYVISGAMYKSRRPERSRTWDISPDFLAKLLTRYQERFPASVITGGE